MGPAEVSQTPRWLNLDDGTGDRSGPRHRANGPGSHGGAQGPRPRNDERLTRALGDGSSGGDGGLPRQRTPHRRNPVHPRRSVGARRLERSGGLRDLNRRWLALNRRWLTLSLRGVTGNHCLERGSMEVMLLGRRRSRRLTLLGLLIRSPLRNTTRRGTSTRLRIRERGYIEGLRTVG